MTTETTLPPAEALAIGGTPVKALAGSVTRMPAGVPHALDADERTRMLLVMLREPSQRSS